MSEVDAETPVNWPTGVDVKPPVAESHLVALILRRPDRRRGYVRRRSIREFDVLVADDDAPLVARDVAAAQGYGLSRRRLVRLWWRGSRG